jgi:hypothetical protein
MPLASMISHWLTEWEDPEPEPGRRKSQFLSSSTSAGAISSGRQESATSSNKEEGSIG